MAESRGFFCMSQRCFEKNMAGLKPPRSIMNTSGRSISRILSNGLRHLCNHLSGQRVAALLGAAYPGLAPPTVGRSTCGDEQSPIVHRRFRPCLALLPTGVTWPPALLQTPVVSYTTFSPSPSARKGGAAVCFCGPLPAGSRLSAVSRPGCYPTSCSMECGLSSIPTTQDRDCPINLRSFDDTLWGDESQPEKT